MPMPAPTRTRPCHRRRGLRRLFVLSLLLCHGSCQVDASRTATTARRTRLVSPVSTTLSLMEEGQEDPNTTTIPDMNTTTATTTTVSTNTWIRSDDNHTGTYAWVPLLDDALSGPDLHGWSLALNEDGSVLAAGSIRSDGPFGTMPRAGMVTVYQWRRKSMDISLATDETDSPNTTTIPTVQWQTTQLHGLAEGDQDGYAVALDASGTVLAMGAPQSSGEGSRLFNRGQVRVMEYNGTDWGPRGAYLEGVEAGALCGYAVALARNGSSLVTGCPFANNQTGLVVPYVFGGQTWATRGAQGSTDGAVAVTDSGVEASTLVKAANRGAAVATNARGTMVVVGAPNQAVNGMEQAGSVQVYRYNWGASQWDPRGQALMGDRAGDRFGYTVAVSGSGSVLACGAPYNSNNGLNASGAVKAYIWDSGISEWVKLGSDLYGTAAGDQFGGSLAISNDGSVIAVGGHLSDTETGGMDSGVVRLFGWNGLDWKQVGDDLAGDGPTEYAGWSLALSGDGKVVAVGAPYANGKVRLYQRILSPSYVPVTDSPTMDPTMQSTGIQSDAPTQEPRISVSSQPSRSNPSSFAEPNDSTPSPEPNEPSPRVDESGFPQLLRCPLILGLVSVSLVILVL